MADKMAALTYDSATDPWETTRGLWKREVDVPVLDEERDPADAARVLVKVRFAGFCGSDRGIWFRRSFGEMIRSSLAREGKTTRIVGHELLGEVVAMGSRARSETTVNVGDVVTTESHLICGRCYQCRAGDTHVCADDKIIGISADGCFAQMAKLPAKTLWPVDLAKIRPEVAAIQEPFGNAVHCAQQVDLRGKRIAILGCGTIGLFLIAIARGMGVKSIIGVEPYAPNAALAKRLGADHVMSPSTDESAGFRHDEALVRKVREMTDGVGVDVAFEMAGPNSSVNNAIGLTRRGGQVILFGLKTGDFTIEHFDRLIVNGLTLQGVVGRKIFETWEITRKILESRDPNVHDQVWNVILNRGEGTIVDFASFDRERFEQALRDHTKVVLKF
jgi:threonine 3-dehydrogenase